MSAYRVHFERIGRSCKDQDVAFEAADADDLAERVMKFARSHLASSMFNVTVDLANGKGSIEFGRFGTFTVTEVAS